MQYVDDVVQMLEHLPKEIRKTFDQLRMWEQQAKDNEFQSKKLQEKLENLNVDDERKAHIFHDLQEKLDLARDIAKKKVKLSSETEDLLEDYMRRMTRMSFGCKLEMEADNAGSTRIVERNMQRSASQRLRPVNIIRSRQSSPVKPSRPSSSSGVPSKISNYMRKKKEKMRELRKLREVHAKRDKRKAKRPTSEREEMERTFRATGDRDNNGTSSIDKDCSFVIPHKNKNSAESSSSSVTGKEALEQQTVTRREASAKREIPVHPEDSEGIKMEGPNNKDLSDDEEDLLNAFPFEIGLDDALAHAFGPEKVDMTAFDQPLATHFDASDSLEDEGTASPSTANTSSTEAKDHEKKMTHRSSSVSHCRAERLNGKPKRIDHTKRAEESFLRNQTQKRERKQEPFKEEEDDDGIYCYCQRPSEGNMIFCDYPKCPYGWFHFGCVGLTATPPGDWFCPECSG